MLTGLERRVAGENLDVQVATVRLAESRAQLGVVGAAQFPTLNANGSYTRQKASDVGVFSGSPNALGANGASGRLDRRHPRLPPQRRSTCTRWDSTPPGRWICGAGCDVRSSRPTPRLRHRPRPARTLLTNLAELARDYIQLRGIQSLLQIARDNVRIAQQSLQLTQQRATGGVTTDLDVANAAAQLRTMAAEIPALEQQESELINAISLLLGQPPNALQAELIKPKPVPPMPPRMPVGLPSELARRRPDIRQAEAQLHAATADIGVAVADFYPSVKLSGSLGLQSLQPWQMFNLDARQLCGRSRHHDPDLPGWGAAERRWCCARRSSRKRRSTTRRPC